MFRRIISTSAIWSTVPIRITLGMIFIAHGSQKVFGAWGGKGFSASIQGSTPFGFMKPAWLWLTLAVASEFLGGIMVATGLLTRLGAFGILCTMMTAIVGVHWGEAAWPNFFMANKGIEYPLALLGMALALIVSGGGQLSIDLSIGSSRRRG
jgi:putative oxidoreductase